MNTDAEDLRTYATHRDEAAFRRLVARHAGMVHGVALRVVGDRSLAEEVTQSVFVILARKAAGLHPGRLPGWLHKTAFSESRNVFRKEQRQRHFTRLYHESAEAIMNGTHAEESWREVSPLVDRILGNLSEEDRNLIVLHYIQGRDFRQIAAMTGRPHEACKKRAQRALSRLAQMLKKRGIVTSEDALAGGMASLALLPPEVSAAGIATFALRTAAVSGAGPLLFFQQLLVTMTTKQIILSSAAALLLVGSVTVAIIDATAEGRPSVGNRSLNPSGHPMSKMNVGSEGTISSDVSQKLTDRPPPVLKEPLAPLSTRLGSVVIPQVDLEGMSISEALETVWNQALELEPTLELGFSGFAFPASANTAKVHSLHLRNCPVSEILRYVADAGKLKVHVSDSIVALYPKQESDLQMKLAPVSPLDAELASKREAGKSTSHFPGSPLAARLDALVIPQINFEGTPIIDAMTQMRVKMDQLDPVLREGLMGFEIRNGTDEVKLYMKLKRVSVGEILRQAAAVNGFQLKLEGEKLVFSPAETK